MRIVTWNCNGAFRKKFRDIEKLNADIYVIQECENPLTSKDLEYKQFAENCLWEGYGNKGLGVFAKSSIKISDNCWESFGLEHFISCSINDEFNLLGVWACGGYIKDFYVYLQIHKEKMQNIVICGDFNSNAIWDKMHRRRTHAAVIDQLEDKAIYSCYHMQYKQQQGKESTPTFYLHKDKNKPYHIDYFFSDRKGSNLIIANYDEWIAVSDHMPLILNY